MALIVQKFGGSSVADRDRIFNVARIVANTHAAGNDVVVVVSAQGDTTDDLIAKAGEITHDPSQREMDMLLATGEQISISLLAMALGETGCPAISLTGWQAGFHTDRAYTRARKLDEITFDEMLELASLGAQVLNNRSVELAKKYSVNLEVRSSLTDLPGTIVKEVTDVEGMLIKGVAKDKDVAVISILEVPDVPGASFKVFSLMAQKKINVDIILQSSGKEGHKDVIFTVPLGDAETALALLEENRQRFGCRDIVVDKDVAKVSIVGAGMQSHSGVASRMFEALFEANINIRMISTSEIKISVLIAKADADRAVNAIHDAFLN